MVGVKHKFEPLPQAEEDALHNVMRLLTIESRPFLRVGGRLLRPGGLHIVRSNTTSPVTATSSAADEAAAAARYRTQEEVLLRWQNEAFAELNLLGQTVLRNEFTTKSNVRERVGYATKKNDIMSEQQTVKDNILKLSDDLQAARENQARGKRLDELCDKIINNKMLKSHAEQDISHAKLDEEITELNAQLQDSAHTFNERRTQFGRIRAQATEMLRMIKDEKEEAERQEGMMKDESEDVEASTRGEASQVGTPRPDGGLTPAHASQTGTPRVDGGATPGHTSQGDDTQTLRPPQDRLAPLSRGASRDISPALTQVDTDMDGESSGIEEGEHQSGEEGETEDDRMDP
ncbi:hypothetical protein P154DRAFT_198871 [Amniculicola lignicola CBS 123094]|uniref:Tho complex subunit 7/Mft1p n=1 Tax=Amniculicola lignicola CBS 123094 TaxID=1392246 RepID=A0A6A5WIG8_9PLEO|nr:hypothetical protein P154DRAFT_198871 [Amniculicola lignicola CBS 123094]